ncbi:MAG: copper homeostasis protein CutC [Ferruginibacter sp.]
MNIKLEVIGFDVDSCIAAQLAGADRIELCDGPNEGGTTPSYGFIKAARHKLSIPIYAIIRPRGGDFLYSDDEYEIMKTDIMLCKHIGCDGVVCGILQADGSVDIKRSSALAALAYPLGVTFHRAFDRVNDPFTAMEDIIGCGFERILTSGLHSNAIDGIEMISKLVEQANDRIIIMPGSGIRADNIKIIATKTKAIEFHTSARSILKSKMIFINEKMNEELNSVTVDVTEIQEIKSILTSMNL